MPHLRPWFLCAALLAGAAYGSECDAPQPGWLFCEDFEAGSLGFGAWFGQSPFVECSGCASGNTEDPDRIRLTQQADQVFDGAYALYMPAEAGGGYRGASLTYRSCAGAKQAGCTLTNHEQLYYRAWVKLDAQHERVHHFMAIGGSQPDGYWDSEGNAGCRPNGYRAAGTTVDFRELTHELFFYTYTPDMSCDSGGYCSGSYAQAICDGCATKDMPCSSGLECCWGNLYEPQPKVSLPKDRWVCLEMMMKLNTPGASDGEMAFWVDGQLGHRQTGMYWREVAELGLNKIWVQHYLDSGDATQPNRIAWDNVVASTQRIGCAQSLPPEDGGTVLPDAGSAGPDAGSPGVDGGGGGPGPDAGLSGGDGMAQVKGCGCASAGGAALWFGLLTLLRLRRGLSRP